MDSSGTFFKPDHFVPLGHGRRVCMGEPLAKAELFIFFVTLVQKIKFNVVEGKEPNPKKYNVGITKVPDDFNVKISPRLND